MYSKPLHNHLFFLCYYYSPPFVLANTTMRLLAGISTLPTILRPLSSALADTSSRLRTRQEGLRERRLSSNLAPESKEGETGSEKTGAREKRGGGLSPQTPPVC